MTRISHIENALLIYKALSANRSMSLNDIEQALAQQGIEKSTDSIRRWLKAWCFVGYVEERREGRHYKYKKVRGVDIQKLQQILSKIVR